MRRLRTGHGTGFCAFSGTREPGTYSCNTGHMSRETLCPRIRFDCRTRNTCERSADQSLGSEGWQRATCSGQEETVKAMRVSFRGISGRGRPGGKPGRFRRGARARGTIEIHARVCPSDAPGNLFDDCHGNPPSQPFSYSIERRRLGLCRCRWQRLVHRSHGRNLQCQPDRRDSAGVRQSARFLLGADCRSRGGRRGHRRPNFWSPWPMASMLSATSTAFPKIFPG